MWMQIYLLKVKHRIPITCCQLPQKMGMQFAEDAQRSTSCLSLPASHSQYTLFTPGQVRQHCKPTNNRFLLFSGEFSTQLRCDERVAGQYLERSGFATWKWIQNIIFSKDLLSSLSSSPYQRVLTSSDQVLHLGLNGA